MVGNHRAVISKTPQPGAFNLRDCLDNKNKFSGVLLNFKNALGAFLLWATGFNFYLDFGGEKKYIEFFHDGEVAILELKSD